MNRTSQRPTIAEFHQNKQYQLMYGQTNRMGTAQFRLTKRNFSLAAGPAPVYKALISIIKKYTFSLLGLKNEQHALGEIKNIQFNIDNILNILDNSTDNSLKNLNTILKQSQTSGQLLKNNTEIKDINLFIKNNINRIKKLDSIGISEGKKFNLTLKEYQKYVNLGAGSSINNIEKFKALAKGAKSGANSYREAQNYVTGILISKIGTINEIITANLFQSVSNLGNNTKLTGALGSKKIMLDKINFIDAKYKGDFYQENDRNLIFSSVKWTSRQDKATLKATEGLSLLQLKKSSFSQFMVDIINLRLSTSTSNSSFNKFIAALLADLAFLGYSGRPLIFISTIYKNNKPEININFMYELFQYYLDTKLYPSTTKLDFNYNYNSLKTNTQHGYIDGFNFYNNVPYLKTRDIDGSGAYMTKNYFNARVKTAAFTIKGKFIDVNKLRKKN